MVLPQILSVCTGYINGWWKVWVYCCGNITECSLGFSYWIPFVVGVFKMGIPGLTSFVDENPWLLQDHQLHNTRLVIDGNNLYHFLYYYFHINHQYGGDYLHFSRNVQYFFTTLRTCQVSPFVIFDGCHDAANRKLSTLLRRARERIHLASFLSQGGRGRILPILAYDTFRTALDECGISHATCQMEADEEIAALANAWDCPVLSNDSDFFVFPLQQGLVLLDYLNLQVHTHTEPGSQGTTCHLQVQLYKQDTLLQHFPGMDAIRFALFATMQGNDYINKSEFSAFYANADLCPVPKKKQGKKRNKKGKKMQPKPKPKQMKMTSLLTFLGELGSSDEAVDYVISFIPAHKQNHVSSELKSSIENYTNLSCKQLSCFSSVGLLDQSMCVSKLVVVDTDPPVLHTREGTPLPQWFLSAVCSGQISVLPLNAVVNHRVLLLAQVEDMSQNSSYACAQPIRTLIYGILLLPNSDCSQTSKSAEQEAFAVEEYDRVKKVLTSEWVEADFSLPDGSPVPKLKDMPSLSVEERSTVFNQGMKLQSLPHPLLSDLHFLMSVISYWICYAQPKVKLVHLYALWLCVLKLTVIGPGKQEEENLEESDCDEISASAEIVDTTHDTVKNGDTRLIACETHSENAEDGTFSSPDDMNCGDKDILALGALKEICTPDQCKLAADNLARFGRPAVCRGNVVPDATHIHAFAQLQAIYKAALDLNAVLQHPFLPNSIALTFQGTFLYNMSVELSRRSQPLIYILEMLGRRSPLAHWYQNSISYIQYWLPCGVFVDQNATTIKKPKKRTQTRTTVPQNQLSDSECDQAGEELDNGSEGEEIDCPLDNRFYHLTLEEWIAPKSALWGRGIWCLMWVFC